MYHIRNLLPNVGTMIVLLRGDMMNFQEKLQALRNNKSISQEQLAEKIGVSRQAVAKWESGTSVPDLNNLILLSEFYKVTIDNLVKTDTCNINNLNNNNVSVNTKILEFLCRAKKATYAGYGLESSVSRPSSHDLEYRENNLKYIDTYLGGEKFAGEEGLWLDNEPFWSMNYVGRVIDDKFSGDFLKEVLSNITSGYPYRGPLVYASGEYKYHCVVNGEFEWFNEYEEIFYGDEKVYELLFHGGNVK